jgi:regulatory protein YycI of two-component signal transduction system YycFG
MDWARAKTILITAFIITNIFLAYNVWQTKYYGYHSERISDRSISQVVEILQDKGIQVNASVPKDIYVDGILTVEYMEIDTDKLFSAVFGDNCTYPAPRDDSVKFVEGGKILEVKNNKEIFYNNLDLRNTPMNGLAEQQAVKIGENFLREYNLYKDTMTVDSIQPIENGYYLSYAQQYKNKPLEVSVVELEITSGGVYSMHMLWLDPVKMHSERTKIVHALDALIKVAGRREVADNAPVVIDSISLVHYFDWETAKEGEALPAWKISVDGEAYYVNALTGQIDR